MSNLVEKVSINQFTKEEYHRAFIKKEYEESLDDYCENHLGDCPEFHHEGSFSASIWNCDCSLLHNKIPSESIDCVITDPPYFVGYKNELYDDSPEMITVNAPKWFEEWYRIMKKDTFLYLFVGVKTLHKWIDYGIQAGFEYKNIIATRSFNNGSLTPRNSFGFQFQPIIVFSKGKGRNYNNVDFVPTSDAWFKDKRNKNPKPFTYEYPNFIPTSLSFATEKRATKNLHPNEKNVKLLKFLIEISTDKDDVVLDSFMGSASTSIAAIQAGRSVISCEIDNKMYNQSVQRICSEIKNLENQVQNDGINKNDESTMVVDSQTT